MHCCTRCTSLFDPENYRLGVCPGRVCLNNLVNMSTGYPPFRICTKYEALTTLYLAPLPPMFLVSGSGVEFATHIQQIYTKVREALTDTSSAVNQNQRTHGYQSKYDQGDEKEIYDAQMSRAGSTSSTAIANISNKRKRTTETSILISNTRFLSPYKMSKNGKAPGYKHIFQTEPCKMSKNGRAPDYKHTLQTRGNLPIRYMTDLSTQTTKDEEAPPQNKADYREDIVDKFSIDSGELRDHLPPNISNEKDNWKKAGTFSSPLEEFSVHQDICTMHNQDDVKRTHQSQIKVGSTKCRRGDLKSDSIDHEIEHAFKRKGDSDPNSHIRDVLDCDLSCSDPKAVDFSMLPQTHTEESEQYDSKTSVQFSSMRMDLQTVGHSMKSYKIQQQIEGAGEQTRTKSDRTGSEWKEICSGPSEGVSPDNQLMSQSNMIVTLTEASINGLKTSEGLVNNKDHCYEAVKEAEYEDALCDHSKDVKISEKRNVVVTKSCSLEELCLLPLQPHFRRLGDIYELLREGEQENKHMISFTNLVNEQSHYNHMISFTNLVKRTITLQPDEPKSMLEMMRYRLLILCNPLGFMLSHYELDWRSCCN